MKAKLPFLPQETQNGTVHRPIIPATIDFEGRTLTALFLVDSGADFSILGRDCAKALGMTFEGNRRDVRGIHGHAVDCHEKRVKLTVPGFGKPFDSTVFVSNELNPVHNLLGRDNFFIQYRVGFDQKQKELFLDDRGPD